MLTKTMLLLTNSASLQMMFDSVVANDKIYKYIYIYINKYEPESVVSSVSSSPPSSSSISLLVEPSVFSLSDADLCLKTESVDMIRPIKCEVIDGYQKMQNSNIYKILTNCYMENFTGKERIPTNESAARRKPKPPNSSQPNLTSLLSTFTNGVIIAGIH
uniref:Uncharacterized protein n=1 Tax=Romanomermis culicivorax TaxID=13658 RepID=A0A915IZY0_ROMCU